MILTFSRLIIILIIILLIYFLLREMKSIKYQKRIEKFALISLHDQEKSFFDIAIIKINKLLQSMSKILIKSTVLKNYSSKYERYISFEEKEIKSKMDFISLKFFVGTILMFLTLFTLIFLNSRLNPVNFLITFLIGFFTPDIILNIKFKNIRKKIEDDLLKAIIMMNNSFKAGHNIMQAVSTVKNELDGPISDEFKKIYMDMTYGLKIEVVFNRFYERVKLEDAKYITSSLSLLNRTGGNIVHVFESIEKSFFEKKKLQMEMKSLTSSSIFVFRILLLLPIFFVLLIFIMNKTYFSPFIKTPYGFLILLLILLLYILYIITIKKIMKVKS